MKTNLLSDQIRRAVVNSGLTHYAVCKAAGIDQGAFSPLHARPAGALPGSLDRLGEVLSLEVVAHPRKAGK